MTGNKPFAVVVTLALCVFAAVIGYKLFTETYNGVPQVRTSEQSTTPAPSAPPTSTPAPEPSGSGANEAPPNETPAQSKASPNGAAGSASSQASNEASSKPAEASPSKGSETAEGTSTPSEQGKAGASSTSAQGQTSAEAAKAAAAATVPSFDVVRVEKTGESVIAGEAAPGWAVEVESDGTAIAKTTADDNGEWTVVPDQPLPPGDHSLTILATSPDGKTSLTSQQSVIVALAAQGSNRQAMVALSEPGKATKILQRSGGESGPQAGGKAGENPQIASAQPGPQSGGEAKPENAQPKIATPAPEAESASSAASSEGGSGAAKTGEASGSQGATSKTASGSASEASNGSSAAAPASSEQGQAASAPSPKQNEVASAPSAQAQETTPSTSTPAPEQGKTASESTPEQKEAASAPSASAPEKTAPQSTQQKAASTPAPNENAVASAPPAPEHNATGVPPAPSAPSGNAVVAEPEGASKPQQVAPSIQIETVDYEDQGSSGTLILSGSAAPGAHVSVLLNGTTLGTTTADKNGQWIFRSGTRLEPGNQQIEADALDQGNTVVARASVGMQRLSPEQLAAKAAAKAQAEAEAAPKASGAANEAGSKVASAEPQPERASKPEGPSVYTVRRGDTLWAIAEQYFGGGWRYTMIFQDNRHKIRNPNLIYPKQEFRIRPYPESRAD